MPIWYEREATLVGVTQDPRKNRRFSLIDSLTKKYCYKSSKLKMLSKFFLVLRQKSIIASGTLKWLGALVPLREEETVVQVVVSTSFKIYLLRKAFNHAKPNKGKGSSQLNPMRTTEKLVGEPLKRTER